MSLDCQVSTFRESISRIMSGCREIVQQIESSGKSSLELVEFKNITSDFYNFLSDLEDQIVETLPSIESKRSLLIDALKEEYQIYLIEHPYWPEALMHEIEEEVDMLFQCSKIDVPANSKENIEKIQQYCEQLKLAINQIWVR
jgi:hypothetical protein